MCERETDRLSSGPKYTKAQVDYKDSSEPLKHRCGICQYHLHVPGTNRMECAIVAGPIEDHDGCKLFSVDLIEASLYADGKPHDH